jgi:hypothetical protein
MIMVQSLALASALVGLAFFALPASAQDPVPAPTLEPGAGGEELSWSTSIELYAFDPPEDDAYLSPIARFGHGAWRFEARYQYEDLDTGSLFAGRAFSFGETMTLELVPLLGLVAGDTDGVAPAIEAEIAWRAFSWSSESEYVIDLDDRDDSFFLSWNEIAYSPAEWISVGFVGNRSRVYEQDLEVDRGLLVGVSGGSFGFTVYWFNPDRDESYLALAFTWER